MSLRKTLQQTEVNNPNLFKKRTWLISMPVLLASSAFIFLAASCSEAPEPVQQEQIAKQNNQAISEKRKNC